MRKDLILCRMIIFAVRRLSLCESSVSVIVVRRYFHGAKGDYVVLQSLLRFHGDHLRGQCVEVELAILAGHLLR